MRPAAAVTLRLLGAAVGSVSRGPGPTLLLLSGLSALTNPCPILPGLSARPRPGRGKVATCRLLLGQGKRWRPGGRLCVGQARAVDPGHGASASTDALSSPTPADKMCWSVPSEVSLRAFATPGLWLLTITHLIQALGCCVCGFGMKHFGHKCASSWCTACGPVSTPAGLWRQSCGRGLRYFADAPSAGARPRRRGRLEEADRPRGVPGHGGEAVPEGEPRPEHCYDGVHLPGPGHAVRGWGLRASAARAHSGQRRRPPRSDS